MSSPFLAFSATATDTTAAAAAAAIDSSIPFLKIKTVVGDEVQPAFADAIELRKEVFCGEQNVTLEEELDGLDAVAVHLIAYMDVTARKEHHERQRVLARLYAASGLPPSIKFMHPSARAVSALKGEPAPRYKPPVLEAVGTLRLRRVSACSQLGKFNMMVGKIERLCVRKEYRRTGVGELLLQQAEKIAKEALHVPWVMLHAQVHAKQFYLHRGYVVWSEKEFLDANIPHIVVVKNLSGRQMNGQTVALAGPTYSDGENGRKAARLAAAAADARSSSKL